MNSQRDDDPPEYSAADFMPNEFESIPDNASDDTKLLWITATLAQGGFVFVFAWGLNRLNDPEVATSGKVFASVILLGGVIICCKLWSEAYRSKAEDNNRKRPNDL